MYHEYISIFFHYIEQSKPVSLDTPLNNMMTNQQKQLSI